jgi:hypothetical protein
MRCAAVAVTRRATTSCIMGLPLPCLSGQCNTILFLFWLCSCSALLLLLLKPSQYCASPYLHHVTLTHPSSYLCYHHFLLSLIVLILVHTTPSPLLSGSGVHVRCDGSRPGRQWNYRPDPLGHNRWHAFRPAKRGTKASHYFPRNYIFLPLFNTVLY